MLQQQPESGLTQTRTLPSLTAAPPIIYTGVWLDTVGVHNAAFATGDYGVQKTSLPLFVQAAA